MNLPSRFLRLPEVIHKTGLRRTTVYKLERVGKFPKRRKLTERSSAWSEEEVLAWMNSRPVAREGSA
jgi:prophage regulatory protein